MKRILPLLLALAGAGAGAGNVQIVVGALDSFAAAGNTDTNHQASLASAMCCKIR